MFVGFTSTMLKLWLFISRFHKFIRRSSADMNVSPSLELKDERRYTSDDRSQHWTGVKSYKGTSFKTLCYTTVAI
jgi:hypothetical protein